MNFSVKFMLPAAAACLLAVAPSVAGPTDSLRTRVTGYRALGAAFKATNDALRSDPVALANIRQSVTTIRKVSRAQYGWYPAGSGPHPGVKTAAKVEIWSNATAFRADQDAFARQADALFRAVNGGDVATIRAEARKLGGTCKACHDTFRQSED